METIDHVLLTCSFARAAWLGFQMTSVIPSSSEFKLHRWLLQLASLPSVPKHHAQQVFSYAAFLCWNMWKSRNELYFDHKSYSLVDVIFRAEKAFNEYYMSVSPSQVQASSMHIILAPAATRTLPPVGCFKLNSDAALKQGSGRVGVAEAIKAGLSDLYVV
ncbi:hypothetical protein NE237_021454 [Protea cynaroides]|uniref:Reverse transcriptase zinc-binding domain-containing protein n=1 Tax=Protea cynaroides TaxID=273540 RepID=A0A9Q0H948_9MAGN|nr:hypothetical protein NE237_021454 [Protea cynaroides]